MCPHNLKILGTRFNNTLKNGAKQNCKQPINLVVSAEQTAIHFQQKPSTSTVSKYCCKYRLEKFLSFIHLTKGANLGQLQ